MQGKELPADVERGQEAPRYELLGVLALSDLARPDSAEMIAHIHSLGIRLLMLTGDNQAIAAEIACEVGIGKDIRRASELRGLEERERLKAIDGCDGFAEVYPQDKYEIVKLLQDAGHMVGMTGDGVNDAPALKQAELGTAVSGATDVARASVSVVLTRPGLSKIVDTVVASRQTYQRMLMWVINKVTKVVEVVVLFSIGYLWLHALPITLLGISLLVSLITIVAFACLGVFGSLIPTLKISQVMCLLLIGVGSALVIDLAKCQLFKRFGL
jgi:H+-transporting ATPase